MRNRLALATLAIMASAPAFAADRTPAPAHNRTCISQINTGNPQPLPDGRVLFPAEPRGKQSWAATFKGGSCPGTRPDSRFIVVHEAGSDVCEGDRVRAFEPTDIIPGPVCIIDHFEPYAEPPRPPR